jgi:hypothetical protein
MASRFLTLTSLALVMACSSSTPGTGAPDLREDGDLSLAITSTDVKVGGEVAFRFTNGSDDTVTTGVLDCVNHYERQDGSTWVPVHPLRACIAMAQLHAPGESNAYQTPAPEQAGTWRLVIETVGEQEGTNRPVRSAPFTVTQ